MSQAGDFLSRGHWDQTGDLFDAAVSQTQTALRRLGPCAEFAGVLWSQGEADALAINLHFETPEEYRRLTTGLIRRFRARFGARTPVFIFQTGSSGDRDQTGFAAVRAEQAQIAGLDPAAPIVFDRAVTFPSRGLMARNGTHYSQAGYNEMGELAPQVWQVTWCGIQLQTRQDQSRL